MKRIKWFTKEKKVDKELGDLVMQDVVIMLITIQLKHNVHLYAMRTDIHGGIYFKVTKGNKAYKKADVMVEEREKDVK